MFGLGKYPKGLALTNKQGWTVYEGVLFVIPRPRSALATYRLLVCQPSLSGGRSGLARETPDT